MLNPSATFTQKERRALRRILRCLFRLKDCDSPEECDRTVSTEIIHKKYRFKDSSAVKGMNAEPGCFISLGKGKFKKLPDDNYCREVTHKKLITYDPIYAAWKKLEEDKCLHKSETGKQKEVPFR